MTPEWSERFAYLIFIGGGLALSPLVYGLVREVAKLSAMLRKGNDEET